jgi:hypothetical protein
MRFLPSLRGFCLLEEYMAFARPASFLSGDVPQPGWFCRRRSNVHGEMRVDSADGFSSGRWTRIESAGGTGAVVEPRGIEPLTS